MNALVRLRNRAGWSRSRLARALGVARDDVDTIESTPLRLLEVDTVQRYLDALGYRLELSACRADEDSETLEVEQ